MKDLSSMSVRPSDQHNFEYQAILCCFHRFDVSVLLKHHVSYGYNISIILIARDYSKAHIFFQGGLISVCEDASLHLWNLRQKQPALINTLKFNKEK